MVAPLQSDYLNRKGIYRDLYREIDSDNRKKEALQVKKPRRGIYVNLYKHLEAEKKLIQFRKKETEQSKENFLDRSFSNLFFFMSRIEVITKTAFGNLFAKIKMPMIG